MQRNPRRQRGFTLIELMVVVAIAAIIAAIATPNYLKSVRKSRRAEAKAALQELAQQQEAYYARNGRYTYDMRELGYGGKTWNTVPRNAPASERHYQVRVAPPSRFCPLESCYRLQARPRRGDAQADDAVKVYELRSNGLKYEKVGDRWKRGWSH